MDDVFGPPLPHLRSAEVIEDGVAKSAPDWLRRGNGWPWEGLERGGEGELQKYEELGKRHGWVSSDRFWGTRRLLSGDVHMKTPANQDIYRQYYEARSTEGIERDY